MKLAIRADAGANIGGGHVMRCRSLAEALDARGWSVSLATSETCVAMAQHLAGGLDILALPGPAEAEPKQLKALLPDGCDVLLVDHYGRGAQFESSCRGWARKIAVLDDFPNRPHDCDLLVDQTVGRQAGDYTMYVPAAGQVCVGAMYALTRRQFAHARWQLAGQALRANIRPARSVTILIALGATDPDDVTATVLRALDNVDRKLVIHAVLSSGAPHLKSARVAAAASRHDARLHVDVSDMATLMTSADLAIGAAGSSAWERCCLGLPTVLVQTADNQRDILAGLVKAGAATSAGRDPQSIASAVNSLIADPSRLGHMRRCALTLCDGLGADRLAVLLGPQAIAPDGGQVTLTPVEEGDAELLLDWQREPETRRHARTQAVPTEAEHLAWFEFRRADPGCILNMITHGRSRAGVVRLDRHPDGNAFEVSIVIAPEKRGVGLAPTALRLVRALLPEERLLAYIRSTNAASRKAFDAAGYCSIGDDWYESRPSAEARGA